VVDGEQSPDAVFAAIAALVAPLARA